MCLRETSRLRTSTQAGDLNDFAKYGLLRQLAGAGGDSLRMRVIWYAARDVP